MGKRYFEERRKGFHLFWKGDISIIILEKRDSDVMEKIDFIFIFLDKKEMSPRAFIYLEKGENSIVILEKNDSDVMMY